MEIHELYKGLKSLNDKYLYKPWFDDAAETVKELHQKSIRQHHEIVEIKHQLNQLNRKYLMLLAIAEQPTFIKKIIKWLKK